jgi:hypothetical protein
VYVEGTYKGELVLVILSIIRRLKPDLRPGFSMSHWPNRVWGFFSLFLLVSALVAALPSTSQPQTTDEQSIIHPDLPENTFGWDATISSMVQQVYWTEIKQKILMLERFGTRYKKSPQHAMVAESLYVFFSNLGLDTEYQTFLQPGLGRTMEAHNVIATQRGLIQPDSIIIISGHYDSMSEIPAQYAPGADDNASGVAAVMTAAEILSKHHFGYTIQYICFASEEYGGLGSGYYCRKAYSEKAPIIGALNFDMIGFRKAKSDWFLEVETNGHSYWLANAVVKAARPYGTSPCRIRRTEHGDSDNALFWAYGFVALNHTEAPYPSYHFNPSWHTTGDELGKLDPVFTRQNVKVAVAALATLARLQPVPPKGSIAGRVTADCSGSEDGLFGVAIDAYAVGSGALAGSATTNTMGDFRMDGLDTGDYTLMILTPLGYSTPLDEHEATVWSEQTTSVDFSLSCLDIAPETRGIGFWKHQLSVATGANGHAHIDALTLCDYLDTIDDHFNANTINGVVLYEPPSSGECADKLLAAKEILNLKGPVGMTARAKQHLMALLLNVASGKISPREQVSKDGATVSQAITYCDRLIDDSDTRNDVIAKDIAENINEGQTVRAGIIPLGTDDIAYAPRPEDTTVPDAPALGQIFPNPFNPTTTIHFFLPTSATVDLRIYNISGSLVQTLVVGSKAAGSHTVMLDGRGVNGNTLASGIYFVRLTAGGREMTKQIVMLK